MHYFDILDLVISHSNHMHFPIDPIAAASDVSEKRHVNFIVSFVTSIFNGLPPICEDEGMVGSPGDGWRLTVANISSHFCYLKTWVYAFIPSIQKEQFTLTTDLILESLFEFLFGLSQLFVLLEEIQMSQHPHNIRETMALQQR
jgi:hypothetical protein